MTNQHQATPDEWAQQENWANRSVFPDSSCLIELRDRIKALEAAQQPPQDKLDRLIALDRDDSTEAATQQPPQFTAKYLFTPSNILFDSFCYDPSDSNSVWFGAIITDLLAPGDNIKIAHRWGEMPSSEVHSTIDYKIVSISENPDYDKRVCTVYATRVDSSDSASAAAPAGSLVERVATDAELCQVYNDAPDHGFGPALRAVYDLGREHGAAPIRSGPESPLVERVADAIAAQATSAGIVNDRPARWGTPAIQPVPASESLPEPEDCDEQGRCWVFDDQLGLPWWTLIKVQGESMDSDMHWLPANALPTPEATS
jgi:hypothetical protein